MQTPVIPGEVASIGDVGRVILPPVLVYGVVSSQAPEETVELFLERELAEEFVAEGEADDGAEALAAALVLADGCTQAASPGRTQTLLPLPPERASRERRLVVSDADGPVGRGSGCVASPGHLYASSHRHSLCRTRPADRGSKSKGIPDQWGSPNAQGFFRDDNSLVKELPGSLTVTSSSQLYKGRRLGNGFVASHLWRELSIGGLASRHPLTYSFVPNLVWLPSEVAALTDREASFVQSYTQAISIKVYRHLPLGSSLP